MMEENRLLEGLQTKQWVLTIVLALTFTIDLSFQRLVFVLDYTSDRGGEEYNRHFEYAILFT